MSTYLATVEARPWPPLWQRVLKDRILPNLAAAVFAISVTSSRLKCLDSELCFTVADGMTVAERRWISSGIST